jgi:GTP-binding protein Era
VDDLRRTLAAALPEGPWHFPEDQVSNITTRLLAAEITREQLYRQLHEELPYASTVETELWEEQKNGSVKIHQQILVQRDTQKAIVLGKSGTRIRAIGSAARAELETLLERRVHLFLNVKVKPDWADDRETYRDMGLGWVD